jgi:hypothetical protein
LFQNDDAKAIAGERQRGGKPANAGAGDNDDPR